MFYKLKDRVVPTKNFITQRILILHISQTHVNHMMLTKFVSNLLVDHAVN